MAIKTKQEVLDGLKKFIPDEDTSDDTLAFLQDVSDTLDAGAENVDYKQKLAENDKNWRQKYRDAFTIRPTSLIRNRTLIRSRSTARMRTCSRLNNFMKGMI